MPAKKLVDGQLASRPKMIIIENNYPTGHDVVIKVI
jgi:hypothetical protein